MAQSKSVGTSQDDYVNFQAKKAEEDFRYSTNVSIGNLERSFQNVISRIEKLDAEYGSREVSVRQELNEVMNSTMASLKEFRQTLGDFGTELFNLKVQVANIKVSLQDYVLKEDFDDTISDMKDSYDFQKKYQEAMARDFVSSIERLRNEYDDKLKAMKAEILAVPSEIPALKKLIDQKLELVDLNGQNAVLRSSNNEKQIQLVERKIENIYQLIKKVDFENQGAT